MTATGVPLVLATLSVFAGGYGLGLVALAIVPPEDPKPVRWAWTALYAAVVVLSALCANGLGAVSWLLFVAWSVLGVVLVVKAVKRRSLLKAAKRRHPADDGPLAW